MVVKSRTLIIEKGHSVAVGIAAAERFLFGGSLFRNTSMMTCTVVLHKMCLADGLLFDPLPIRHL